ncbi:extracellular solute-binding protein [Roseomonas sp. CAU 1739]|uniref:ABC transporter substrate-binding protein n=1 Tax=Roseomonas sp. CAU 1739 TaxID=3140364 RepID=UPI00325AB1B2
MTLARIARRRLLAGGGALVAGAVAAPPVLGQARPFAGQTLNGAAFQSTFFEYLKGYFPEFEERSGARVNFNTQAFPVYNQRTDLELSTRGSSLDVCNVTFIYSGRWMGAGWLTNLSDFVNDSNNTAPDWDAADFVSGAQSPVTNSQGQVFGFAWEAGASLLSASRHDLLLRAGLGMPTTFDEMTAACEAVHGRGGVSGYVNDRLHHWNWVPYLMGMGGRIFRDPPANLTPTLATPEAIRAAQWYAELMSKYGAPGMLSFTDDQAMRAQMAGRAMFRSNAITWMVPLAKHAESTVRDTMRISLMPAGPAGNFPGSNSHCLGIPAGSRRKELAWAFIQWALSKDMLNRIVQQYGYPSVCRRSVITGEAFRQALTLNGQDVASLYLQVLELGGRSGYMKYRTVPVFPQVGDTINRGIDRIATRQQSAEASMRQTQQDAIQVLQRAGAQVDPG